MGKDLQARSMGTTLPDVRFEYLGGPLWSQGLDLMILMDPFNLRVCLTKD